MSLEPVDLSAHAYHPSAPAPLEEARSLDRRSAAAPTSPAPASPRGPLPVLVVDDEPPVRELIGEILRAAGLEVHLAEDGEAALALIAGGLSPRLLVTDIGMPGLSGPELAEIVFERMTPPPQLLFVSGYPRAAAQLAGLPPEADYLKKPFGLEDLLRRVTQLLEAEPA